MHKQQSCLAGNMKLSRHIVMYILAAGFIVFIMAGTSCKKYTFREEIMSCDSLMARLDNLKEMLMIDDMFLERRADSMLLKINCISRLDSNLFNDELKYDFVTYRAIYSDYQEFIPLYRSHVFDNEVFIKKTKEVRKKFLEGKPGKEKLDQELEELGREAELHFSSSREIVRNIINLEKIYGRLQPKMDKLYEAGRSECK